MQFKVKTKSTQAPTVRQRQRLRANKASCKFCKYLHIYLCICDFVCRSCMQNMQRATKWDRQRGRGRERLRGSCKYICKQTQNAIQKRYHFVSFYFFFECNIWNVTYCCCCCCRCRCSWNKPLLDCTHNTTQLSIVSAQKSFNCLKNAYYCPHIELGKDRKEKGFKWEITIYTYARTHS